MAKPETPSRPVEWADLDTEKRLRETYLPKALPQEAQLLQIAFIEPEAARMIFDILKPWHFYEPARQKLFKVMAEFFGNGRALEPLGVRDVLVSNGMDRMNASSLVNEFLGIGVVLPWFSTKPEIWVGWLEAVVMAAAKRFLLKAAQKAHAEAVDGGQELDAVIAELRANLQKIENIGLRKQSTDWLTLLDNPATQSGVVSGAIPTGFRNWDALLRGGGFIPGDLIFAGARTSRGKSTLCLQALCQVADNYIRGEQRPPVVAYFPLESSKEALVRRALGIRAMLSAKSVRLGQYTPEEDARRIAELRRMVSWKFEVMDKRGVGWLDIQRECRAIKQKHGHLDLVCVDYLNLIMPENKRAPRQEQLEESTGQAKTFAGNEGLPLILPVQIKRQALDSNGNRRKFGLDDFRGSGSIEQDADVCLILQEPDEIGTGGYEIEATQAKQREGQVGGWKFFFNRTYGGFDEVQGSVFFGETGIRKPKAKKKHGPLYQEEDAEEAF